LTISGFSADKRSWMSNCFSGISSFSASFPMRRFFCSPLNSKWVRFWACTKVRFLSGEQRFWILQNGWIKERTDLLLMSGHRPCFTSRPLETKVFFPPPLLKPFFCHDFHVVFSPETRPKRISLRCSPFLPVPSASCIAPYAFLIFSYPFAPFTLQGPPVNS